MPAVTLDSLRYELRLDDKVDIGPAMSKIQGFRDAMTGAGTVVQGFGQRLSALGAGLSVAVAAPLGAVGGMALITAGKLEQTKIAFTTMLGSAEKANAFLQQMRDFAARTPFEFTDLLEAARRMQALGFQAEEVLPMLESIGSAASALGLGAAGVDRITLALGQMRAKGKVSGEEMRQLAEAGIPAWQFLADAISKTEGRTVSVAEVMKRSERGAIDAAIAVTAIVGGMQAKFGGLMDAQSKTLLGVWSNFKDKMGFILTDIGEAIVPVARRWVDRIIGIGDAVEQLVKKFRELPVAVQEWAVTLGLVGVALPPVLFGFSKLVPLIPLFGSAISALLSPIGLVVIAITGMVAVMGKAFLTYRQNTGELLRLEEALSLYALAQSEGSTITREAGETTEQFLERLRALRLAYQDLNSLQKDFKLVMREGKLEVEGNRQAYEEWLLRVKDLRQEHGLTVLTAGQAKVSAEDLVKAFEALGLKTREQLVVELREAERAVRLVERGMKEGVGSAQDLTTAQAKVAEIQKKLSGVTMELDRELRTQAASFERVITAFGRGQASYAEARRAADALLEIQTKLNPVLAETRTLFNEQFQAMGKAYRQWLIDATEANRLTGLFKDANVTLDRELHSQASVLETILELFREGKVSYAEAGRAVDALLEIQKKLNPILAETRNRFNEQFLAQGRAYQQWLVDTRKVLDATISLKDAYEQLGIVSGADVTAQATKTRQSVQKVAEDQSAGFRAQLEAEIKLHEAERKRLQDKLADQRNAGDARARETERELRDMDRLIQEDQRLLDQITGSAGRRSQQFRQEMSTILNDLNRGITEAIFKAKSFGDVFTSTLEEIGKAIVRHLIANIVDKLLPLLDKVISKIPVLNSLLGAGGGGGGRFVNITDPYILRALGSIFGTSTPFGNLPTGGAGGGGLGVPGIPFPGGTPPTFPGRFPLTAELEEGAVFGNRIVNFNIQSSDPRQAAREVASLLRISAPGFT